MEPVHSLPTDAAPRRPRRFAVRRRASAAVLICLLAAAAAGCGASSPKQAKAPTTTAKAVALAPIRSCLSRRNYNIQPDSLSALETAPRRFQFVTVWNLVNPNRVALALTISRTAEGAARAAAWTRRENRKIGKGVVAAPVVRFGRIDVLWTAKPDPPDVRNIYPCVRKSS